jgi:hypothetical protein
VVIHPRALVLDGRLLPVRQAYPAILIPLFAWQVI